MAEKTIINKPDIEKKFTLFMVANHRFNIVVDKQKNLFLRLDTDFYEDYEPFEPFEDSSVTFCQIKLLERLHKFQAKLKNQEPCKPN